MVTDQPLRLGSLCTGYGGLDLAAEAMFDNLIAVWCAEFEEAQSRVIAARFDDLPNLHDVKRIPWWILAPIDVMTAGYPCQPFSYAGARKGADDERHLWPAILEGITIMRPRHVLLENVRGHLTLGFDQVLADLHHAGYGASWRILEAAAVGACHLRARLFIYAQPVEHMVQPTSPVIAVVGEPGGGLRDAQEDFFGDREPFRGKLPQSGSMVGGKIHEVLMHQPPVKVTTLPTPNTMEHLPAREGEARERQLRRGEGEHASRRQSMGNLREDILSIPIAKGGYLPTPDASVANDGEGYSTCKARRDYHASKPVGATRAGMPLSIAVQTLPTPRAANGMNRPLRKNATDDTRLEDAVAMHLTNFDGEYLPTPRSSRGASSTEIAYALGAERSNDDRTQGEVVFVKPADWGKYANAIIRHACMMGTEPPIPTQPNHNGKPELAPAFVEWMQGLPAGWVTDPALWDGVKPKKAREQQLHMLGNGVVWMQALVAYQTLAEVAATGRLRAW